MNPKLKKLLSLLFILVSVGTVVIIAFSNPEMKNAWEAISKLSLPWIGGLLLCWFVYVLFEAMGTWICLRRRGYDISLFRVLGTGLIGMYYSNITPGASGGQPMQVNSLRKAGVPVEYGTLALTVRFVMNQFAVCMIGLILFLIHKDFVYKQLGGAIWAARIGWLINFASVPLVLLAAFKRNWIQKLGEKLIALGEKIHVIRNPEVGDAGHLSRGADGDGAPAEGDHCAADLQRGERAGADRQHRVYLLCLRAERDRMVADSDAELPAVRERELYAAARGERGAGRRVFAVLPRHLQGRDDRVGAFDLAVLYVLSVPDCRGFHGGWREGYPESRGKKK